ncbi:hypothetical protein BGZ81_008035 [Podila clonocystis]|nr:hypothetical protein BGZ81_008035 [Podila clonocystis]
MSRLHDTTHLQVQPVLDGQTPFTPLEYAAPSLFLVLPSDLASWDDTGPSTHTFRLYFLCGYTVQGGSAQAPLQQNIHIADHQGYKIRRPQEFLTKYGHYALRVLKVMQQRLSTSSDGGPPPTPWPSGTGTPKHDLLEENIALLCDKAIELLTGMLPFIRSEMNLSATDTREIVQYLDVQQGDNSYANLFRIISSDRTDWMCHSHAHEYLNEVSLTELEGFVRDRGGHIDVQQGTLNVHLATEQDAAKFVSLLETGKQVFDVSLKLGWSLSEAAVSERVRDFSRVQVVALELDGITLDAYSQDHAGHNTDIFADLVSGVKARLVRLLNYPQAKEQYVYTGKHEDYVCGFKAALTSPTLVQWHIVQGSLGEFKKRIIASAPESIKTCAKELPTLLAQHGILDVCAITIKSYSQWWIFVDLLEGTIPEVQLYDSLFSMDLFKTGTLRQLTLDFIDPQTYLDLRSIFDANIGIREMRVMTQAHSVFHDIESFQRIREGYSHELLLTLFEQSAGKRRRILTHVTLSEQCRETSGKGKQQSAFAGLNFVHWNLDYISAPLTDQAAAIMDLISAQHPKILKSFTLDVSYLSRVGLASVQNILQRSMLEHLQVVCSPFHPELSDALAQVFHAVQWLSIKSLTFSGDDIDKWIQSWGLSFQATSPQLLQVEICGGGSAMQELSHSNVVYLVQLLYPCPLVSLTLENVQLQDKKDWNLISRFTGDESGLVRPSEEVY